MGAGIGGKCTFSDETPTHICIHFIFIANKCIALHFPSNDIGLSSLNFFLMGARIFVYFGEGAFPPFKGIQGHWYWCQSKARTWLPISNSNLGPILHRFGDRTRFMCSGFLTPPLFNPNFGVFPLHQIAYVGVSQSRGLKLFGREIIFEEFQPIWTRYLIVTDRQTDRQTDDMQSHHRALR